MCEQVCECGCHQQIRPHSRKRNSKARSWGNTFLRWLINSGTLLLPYNTVKSFLGAFFKNEFLFFFYYTVVTSQTCLQNLGNVIHKTGESINIMIANWVWLIINMPFDSYKSTQMKFSLHSWGFLVIKCCFTHIVHHRTCLFVCFVCFSCHMIEFWLMLKKKI